MLGKLMLKAALVEGPAKVVLFSSKSSSNIHENVKTSSETGLDESARRLYGKIQREQGTWS